MAAYAAAWAGDSPLAADAVTASPYLGFGSLRPLLEAAAAHDRGVFVAGGHAPTRRARPCSGPPSTAAPWPSWSSTRRRWSTGPPTPSGPGYVGVVVGATVFEAPDVSALGGPVLVPGVGVQGGAPEALARPRWGRAGPAAARGGARGAAGRPERVGSAGRGRTDARRRRLSAGAIARHIKRRVLTASASFPRRASRTPTTCVLPAPRHARHARKIVIPGTGPAAISRRPPRRPRRASGTAAHRAKTAGGWPDLGPRCEHVGERPGAGSDGCQRCRSSR